MTETENHRGLVAVTQTEAASTLGCSTRTLQRWLADGCPGSPKCYCLAEIILWARENVWSEDAVLIEGATGEAGDIKTEYLRKRIEKIDRENQLADFKIAERNENLVDADQVKALLTEQANIIRSALEKLERKYGKDALDIVLEVFDELDAIDLKGAAP